MLGFACLGTSGMLGEEIVDFGERDEGKEAQVAAYVGVGEAEPELHGMS